jgi:hypothetical protein
LTVAEAQRVQPDYGDPGPDPGPDPERTEIHHYRRNSALLGAVSVASIAVNASHPGARWMGPVGFAAGGFQILLGAQKLSKDSVVASANLFVGAAAMLTSLSALADGGSKAAMRVPDSKPQLRPLLGFDPALEPRAGFALSF